MRVQNVWPVLLPKLESHAPDTNKLGVNLDIFYYVIHFVFYDKYSYVTGWLNWLNLIYQINVILQKL